MRTLAGAALGRLVAANTPALKGLNVTGCELGDDGLRPLFAALPSNTYLGILDAERNGISAAFAPVVLAYVKANQSLRQLYIVGYEEVSSAELREAEALVKKRRVEG